MFTSRLKWPVPPVSTMVVVFVLASATWFVVAVLQLLHMPLWLAASVPGAAMPALVAHARRVAYYNRVARLVERYARRELKPCPLCKRAPFITTHAHGGVADAHVSCLCGVSLNVTAKAKNLTLPFQLRLSALERAMEHWNTERYRQSLRDQRAARCNAMEA